MKDENQNKNGVLEWWSDGVGSGGKPMLAGGLARSAGDALQVQSLRFKVQSHKTEDGTEAEFEDLRLKMRFSPRQNDEFLKPND